MILESQRIVLKILDESQGQSVLDYLNKNRNFFSPWTSRYADVYFTLDYQEKCLKERLEAFKEERELRFYIFKKTHTDSIIGDLGFSNIIKGSFWSCHLGYKMDEDNINKGYMTEALKAAMGYMFEKVTLHRIEANVMPANKPSIRLLEKLGFENEGLSRKYLKINGVWEDHIRFALFNESVE